MFKRLVSLFVLVIIISSSLTGIALGETDNQEWFMVKDRFSIPSYILNEYRVSGDTSDGQGFQTYISGEKYGVVSFKLKGANIKTYVFDLDNKEIVLEDIGSK